MLEFANVDLTLERIERSHRQAAPQRANFRKQAQQVRVCVLQAKEYFDAARASSLFTSPNHAYYGAVSLASAMMLILGDGTRSLDYLRKDAKNRHHGLNFSVGCTANAAASGLRLVENSFAEILTDGHFANWYTTLPRFGDTTAVVTRHLQARTFVKNLEIVGSFSVPTIEALTGKKRSILDALKYLPDLSLDLDRYSVGVPQSRCSHELEISPQGVRAHRWVIHGARSQEDRDAIVSRFEIHPRFAEGVTCQVDDTHVLGMIITIRWQGEEMGVLKFPNIREALNRDTIVYAHEADTHEIVDLYFVAYQLSMLARYFPDLWVSCIEAQCKGAKLIERGLDVIIQKLPILALSMLSGGLTISTHQPPWQS